MRRPPPIDDFSVFLLRCVCLAVAGVSFGACAATYAAYRVIVTLPPERFEGGPGLALNAPIMLYGFCGAVTALIGVFLLVVFNDARWQSLARFPNPLTILLLLPGLWFALRTVLMIVYNWFRYR